MYDRMIILDEGMNAALDGLPLTMCSYPAGSEQREIWIEGWESANDGERPEERLQVGAPKREPSL